MSAIPVREADATFPQLLTGLITRFAGALEFWTVACISQVELGDPSAFIDSQWSALLDDVQALRFRLSETGADPSPVVQEQIAKLTKSCSELREVFDRLVLLQESSSKELEMAVLRLSQLWQDFRMRVALLGVLLAVPMPTPPLTTEQENYYQGILDGLFDRLEAARPKSVFDGDPRKRASGSGSGKRLH